MGGAFCHLQFVMVGVVPATQWPRACAAVKFTECSRSIDGFSESPARTDVRALGGRVKPGHDELTVVAS
jgi:hypothetical protein